jgi:hypothetical protein
MRKDRYSALVIANMLAHIVSKEPKLNPNIGTIGGFAHSLAGKGLMVTRCFTQDPKIGLMQFRSFFS